MVGAKQLVKASANTTGELGVSAIYQYAEP